MSLFYCDVSGRLVFLLLMNWLIDWLMSPGSKGIPGVWKARTGKKGVATMSWIRLKSLRCALPTSWEMEKSEWQCRYRPRESVTLLWRVLRASVKRGRANSECYHVGPSSQSADPATPNAALYVCVYVRGRPVRTKASFGTHVFVLLGFRSDGISFQRDRALQRVAYWL